jgi:hypothetical protein
MVAPVHEHQALVPRADRSALLLVGGRLPVVRLDEAGIRAAQERATLALPSCGARRYDDGSANPSYWRFARGNADQPG